MKYTFNQLHTSKFIESRTIGRLGYGFLVLCIASCLGACASNSPQPTASLQDMIARESVAKHQIDELNHKLFASARNAPRPEDYIIGEGDLLQVSVFEEKELNTEARVGTRGFVTLPLIGVLELGGLTAREAEQKIEDAYQKEYLEDPHISIFVKERYGSKITLLGELKSPGTYDYYSQQRVLDVLALAGGLSENAGRRVQVRREDKGPSANSTFLIDLDQLVKEGKEELNIAIRGGDVIYVPEAGQVYVDGAVRRPGDYPIKRAMTVQEAITAAGGFASTADEEDIKLVRFGENGKREVLQLNTKDIRSDWDDIEVKDRDILFVETNTLEALVYGLRLNAGFGLVGIGYSPPPQ